MHSFVREEGVEKKSAREREGEKKARERERKRERKRERARKRESITPRQFARVV